MSVTIHLNRFRENMYMITIVILEPAPQGHVGASALRAVGCEFCEFWNSCFCGFQDFEEFENGIPYSSRALPRQRHACEEAGREDARLCV